MCTYSLLTLTIPMSEYQVPTMKKTEVTYFSMIDSQILGRSSKRRPNVQNLTVQNTIYLNSYLL